MRKLALAIGCSAVLAGACVEDPALPDGSTSAPIVNGTGSLTDDAVVALTVSGQHFCTGTLVRENIVLTAAHCLPPNLEVPATSIEIFFGRSLADGGEFIGVVDALAHPAWNLDAIADDVGIIALASPSSVTPIPMRTQPMTGLAGESMRMVGFGITEAEGNDNGIRRQGTGTIDQIDASSIVLEPEPAATCNGDSGGPAFFDDGSGEQLAGIHSRSDCFTVFIDERVDRHIDDFIMPFIAEHGGVGCGDDGTCNAECANDPDCGPVCEADGACVAECADDPDCGPVCEADGTCVAECTDDPDCGPVCEADEVCVAECGDVTPDPDCEVDPGADDDGGGCSVSDRKGAAWWLVFACVLGLRRRR